jgi:high frequency lysogenization protein
MGLHEANKTMALAGIFQAAILVHQIAFNQKYNEQAFLSSIESILKINLPDVASLFGNSENIQYGLSYLIYYSTNDSTKKEDKLLIKYLLYMTKLAKHVLSNKNLFNRLQHRLKGINLQAEHLGHLHDIVIRELALLYRQSFVSIGLDIPVFGKRSCFKGNDTLNKIYALLLAGIRASVLWYQVGGSRLELFFSRTRLKKQAILLLNHDWQSLTSH